MSRFQEKRSSPRRLTPRSEVTPTLFKVMPPGSKIRPRLLVISALLNLQCKQTHPSNPFRLSAKTINNSVESRVDIAVRPPMKKTLQGRLERGQYPPQPALWLGGIPTGV
jgi:hypothetical protein